MRNGAQRRAGRPARGHSPRALLPRLAGVARAPRAPRRARDSGLNDEYETLIEPAELHAHLNDAAWSIVDCRFDLAQPQAGRQAYGEAHIPGAHYAHLDQDLSSPITATSGRHPLP